MKTAKIIARCCYAAGILGLTVWILGGLSPHTKSHKEVETTLQKLLANQPVNPEERLKVADFLDQTYSEKWMPGLDTSRVRTKIRNGQELDKNDQDQLLKMLNSLKASKASGPDLNI